MPSRIVTPSTAVDIWPGIIEFLKIQPVVLALFIVFVAIFVWIYFRNYGGQE